MWTIFNIFIEFVTILLLFSVLVSLAMSHVDLSSPTRDRTCTPGIGKRSINHWITREVPGITFHNAYTVSKRPEDCHAVSMCLPFWLWFLFIPTCFKDQLCSKYTLKIIVKPIYVFEPEGRNHLNSFHHGIGTPLYFLGTHFP